MMIRPTIFTALAALFIACIASPFTALAEGPAYTIKADVNIRSGLGLNNKSLGRLDHNESLEVLDADREWRKVRTVSGLVGYVRNDMLSDVWVKVHKKERRLYVLKSNKVIREYPIGLAPANPLGDKEQLGDSGTPEGRFFVCESIRTPKAAKYGARSMRLDYPNIEDARRGLATGMIDFGTYKGIVRAVRAGKMPNQNTKLGGSIRIHGGGSSGDWTLGCIALDDKDIIELYDMVPAGVRVEVYKSMEQDRLINSPGYLSARLLAGAKAQLIEPALYTTEATGLIRLEYPGGDIKPEWAVCTDVVIRSFRQAGLDLQALLHEDAVIRPDRYKPGIGKPNYHIDHRRTRNLQRYFSAKALVLPNDAEYKPGDVVTMDTGIENGTVFDHIGIVSDARDEDGIPAVINIWTVGYKTMNMDLLGNDYPTVVGHFRMGHPFDYQ